MPARSVVTQTATTTQKRRGEETLIETRKYDDVNEAATFTPQFVDGADGETLARPCLTVAGVQVYAYVGDDGMLRVTVDTETADELDREIIHHNDDSGRPAVIVQTGEPIHVFGDVNVITGPHGAAEKLATLNEDDD
jgi:hypothetical protein